MGTFYHRGVLSDKEFAHFSHLVTRFLNSGVIAGRVGQLRDLLTYCYKMRTGFRNDQTASIHYSLQNADMIGLDVDNNIIMSTLKMESIIGNSYISNELSFVYQPKQKDDTILYRPTLSIGYLHFNGNKDNSLYDVLVPQLLSIYQQYYSGGDGELLLKVVNLMHDEEYTLALELLHDPIIVSNMTSRGGSNHIADKLIEFIHKTNL